MAEATPQQPAAPAWGPSVMPESVENNRRRLMQSSIFGDDPPPQQQRSNPPPAAQNYQQPPTRAYQAPYNASPPQQAQHNAGYAPPMNNHFSNIVVNSEIPSLTPFPDFKLDVGPITEQFDLGIKQRTPIQTKPPRKMNFTTGNQMKLMREEIAADFMQFSDRMKKLSTNEPLHLETLKLDELHQMSAAHTPVKQRQQVHQQEEDYDDQDIPAYKNQNAAQYDEYDEQPIPTHKNQNAAQYDEYDEQPIPTLKNQPKMQLNEYPDDNEPMSNNTSSLEQEIDETPGFTTASEFILPDGSKYSG